MNDQPLVCMPDAINKQQQHRHDALFATITGAVQTVHETPNGYQLVLPIAMTSPAAEFITLERLCCPFLEFTLQVAPGSDTVCLTLSGREGVKDFLRGLIEQMA